MIFNMILPQVEEVETIISKVTALPSSSASITFSGITAIPKFFVMVKEPSTRATSTILAWICYFNNSATSCRLTSTSSSSTVNISIGHDSTASISSSGLSLTDGSGLITSETYDLFYTDGNIKAETIDIPSYPQRSSLEFAGVRQSDTSKFLLLLHTDGSSGGSFAYWVREGSNILQARGYSSTTSTSVSIRTTNSSTEITESYTSNGLVFSKSGSFGSGDYTIYYA